MLYVLQPEAWLVSVWHPASAPVPDPRMSQSTRQLTARSYQQYDSLQVRVVVPQDGYVTAYVGSQSNVDVYFDNLTVEHRQGLQVQETQYAPWGLSLAGLTYNSPGTSLLNKRQFNGIEFVPDLGLNTNPAFYRVLDPQLGRWWQLDPKYNFYESPYVAMGDNAVTYSDPLGDVIQLSFRDGFLGLFGKKHTVQYESGVLQENGQAYTGKMSGFAKKTVKALDAIAAGGEAGKALVGDLQSRNEVITIQKAGSAGNKFTPKTNTVSWSPGNGGMALNTDGTTTRPAFIGLGHELAHGYDWFHGTLSYRTWYTNKEGKDIPAAEIFSTHYENMLRSENGIVLRAYYGAQVATNSNNVSITVGGDGDILIHGTRKSANVSKEVYENPNSGPLSLPALQPVSKPWEY